MVVAHRLLNDLLGMVVLHGRKVKVAILGLEFLVRQTAHTFGTPVKNIRAIKQIVQKLLLQYRIQ